jgi:hypothetical protein
MGMASVPINPDLSQGTFGAVPAISAKKPQRTLTSLPEGGAVLRGAEGEHVRELSVTLEGAQIEIWIKVTKLGEPAEFVQYLTPEQAMSFSKAFRRLAIEAFEKQSP